MTEFNVTEAMDVLHDYANQLNDLHDEIGHIYDAYGDNFVPNSLTLRIDNDRRDLLDLTYPVADNLKSYFLSSRHGGVRPGAGRKKKEPTIQVRLPESIAGFCYGIRDEYDSMDDEGKKKVIGALESVLKQAQTTFKDNIPF